MACLPIVLPPLQSWSPAYKEQSPASGMSLPGMILSIWVDHSADTTEGPAICQAWHGHLRATMVAKMHFPPQSSQCGKGKWPASCLPKFQVSVNGNSRTEERGARDRINSIPPGTDVTGKGKGRIQNTIKVLGLSIAEDGGQTTKTRS